MKLVNDLIDLFGHAGEMGVTITEVALDKPRVDALAGALIDTTLITPPAAERHVKRHRNCFKHGGTHQSAVEEDYTILLPHLPAKVDVILDVGCGMAGIDVLLSRHYPDALFLLLDGDGADPRDGWEKNRPEPFSSRAAAEELLIANGVDRGRWRWIAVNTKEALRADLVISLASWGYHYPIKTYDVTGYCIADLRRSEEPARGVVIHKGAKFDRCAWNLKGTAA